MGTAWVLEVTRNKISWILIIELSGRFKRFSDGLKRKEQRERVVKQRHSPVTRVPSSNSLVFRIDEKRNSSHLQSDHEAASARSEQKLASQTASLNRMIDCKSRESENRHFMPGEAAPNQLRSAIKFDRRRADAVKAKSFFCYWSLWHLVVLYRVCFQMVQSGSRNVKPLQSRPAILILTEIPCQIGCSDQGSQTILVWRGHGKGEFPDAPNQTRMVWLP